jgi:hypothetical protein
LRGKKELEQYLRAFLLRAPHLRDARADLLGASGHLRGGGAARLEVREQRRVLFHQAGELSGAVDGAGLLAPRLHLHLLLLLGVRGSGGRLARPGKLPRTLRRRRSYGASRAAATVFGGGGGFVILRERCPDGTA